MTLLIYIAIAALAAWKTPGDWPVKATVGILWPVFLIGGLLLWGCIGLLWKDDDDA